MGNLTGLVKLKLNNNQFTGSLPSSISNLINLNLLDLSHNQISGNLPDQINNLSNLSYLFLQNNQFTDVIAESICEMDINWSSNYYFNISNNNFCPQYPICIENNLGDQNIDNCSGIVELWGEQYFAEAFTELDFQSSGIQGEIPPEIGEFINLESLNLSSNQLTGSIPTEIGALSNLKYLDLSFNQLAD